MAETILKQDWITSLTTGSGVGTGDPTRSDRGLTLSRQEIKAGVKERFTLYSRELHEKVAPSSQRTQDKG
jgi:hypothetical protein